MFEEDLAEILDSLVRGGGDYLDGRSRPGPESTGNQWLSPYYPPQSHRYAEIILLRSGRLMLYLNGRWTEYTEPHPRILLPGTVHTEHWASPGTAYRMFWMTVSPDGLNLHHTMYVPGRNYDQSALRLHTASPYAQRLWQCSQNQPVDVVEFHCLLLESLHFTLENGGFDSINYHRDAVLQVKNYIEQFFYRKITLDELGSLVHYTPMHLNRLFKAHFKIPIHACLANVRLNHAAELLKQDGGRILDIAGACGFEDQRYFSRAFKIRFGCTPQEYRNKNRTS